MVHDKTVYRNFSIVFFYSTETNFPLNVNSKISYIVVKKHKDF